MHRAAKRAIDIIFSLGACIISLPLLIGIACAIKLSSSGPIFYASRRKGLKGKIIYCWKYRSMCVNADSMLQEVIANDPSLKAEWERFAKLKNDPRVTKIGKWLRRNSLDELPQLWNVLKGDLSLVGPRPYLVEEVEQVLKERAEKILSVKPGLTGMWQTSGRNNLTLEERIEMERLYVEKQSLLLDLILIFKTIPLFVFPNSAC
jgi:exopolysaccharide production protein ExoY